MTFDPSEVNTAFSKTTPCLQLAWDSTSLGKFKECPYKYYLSMILGYAPRHESVHLTFGTLYHGALERYDHAKFAGQSHEEAVRVAVRWTMEQTWDKAKNRPWLSDDPNKNRYTLVRTIVWYLVDFKDDPIETIRLSSGKPAVELSFRFESPFKTQAGEQLLLCGHLDRVGIYQGQTWIVDRKTSKNTINTDYFAKFSPDNQFTTYTLAAKIAFHTPVKGLIVDAAQVAQTFSRFQRGIVHRSEDQLEEWLEDTGDYLARADTYARRGKWPMNDKACGNFGGCEFRSICSHRPSVRKQWLQGGFHVRVWDPLHIRGDI